MPCSLIAPVRVHESGVVAAILSSSDEFTAARTTKVASCQPFPTSSASCAEVKSGVQDMLDNRTLQREFSSHLTLICNATMAADRPNRCCSQWDNIPLYPPFRHHPSCDRTLLHRLCSSTDQPGISNANGSVAMWGLSLSLDRHGNRVTTYQTLFSDVQKRATVLVSPVHRISFFLSFLLHLVRPPFVSPPSFECSHRFLVYSISYTGLCPWLYRS